MPIGKKQTDIIISGGGIPSLTLALLCAQIGLDVTVIEPCPPATPKKTTAGNRTSALMQGSLNVLKAAGLDWGLCAPHCAALKTLRIIDETSYSKNKTVKSDFEAHEIGLDAFAENIPNNILHALLWDKCKKIKAIKLLHPVKIEGLSYSDTAVTVTLSNGKTISGKLLVGADGRSSAVRTLLDIPCKQTDYKQSAMTCHLEHSLPHDFISTEFHYQGGPFTLVPLPGNNSSLVWVEAREIAEKIMALRKQDLEAMLQSKSHDVLGKIKLSSAPTSFPLIGMKAKKLTAPRTALIAEAAHVLHPMGAQGLNLSIRDVAALSEAIADHIRLGIDPGSIAVLNEYENKRRADINTRTSATYGLAKFLHHEITALHSLRRSGLRLVSSIPALKEKIMKEGLAPDIAHNNSRLAQGEAL